MGLSRQNSTSFLRPLRISLLLPIVLLAACGGQHENLATPPVTQLRAAPATTKEFSQPRNNYRITKIGQTYEVTDISGKEATVTVSEDSVLKFTDVTVNLSINNLAGSIKNEDLNSIIELYIAFFNRVPDADGLSYWITQFKQGMTLQTIADNFYAAAIIYADQTGYSKDMSEADFVRIVYKNVLGRYGQSAPPDADVQYWANNLIQKTATKASLISSMLYAAHTFKGDAQWSWVPQLLENKISTGKYFSVQQGLNYLSPQDSILKGQAIVQAISSSSASSAINLINVNDSTFAASSPINPQFTSALLSGQTFSFGSTTLRFSADGTAKIQDRNPDLTQVTWKIQNGLLEIQYASTQVLDYPAGSLKLGGIKTTAAIQEISSGRVYQLVSGTADNGEVKWGETGSVKWADGPNKDQAIDGSSVGVTTTNKPSFMQSVHNTSTRLKIDAQTIAPGKAFAGANVNSTEAMSANVLSFITENKSQFLYGLKMTSSWYLQDNYLYVNMDGDDKMPHRYSLQDQASDGTQTWLAENLSTGSAKLMSGVGYSLPTPKIDEALAIHKWTDANGTPLSYQLKADKTATSSIYKMTWEITAEGALLITSRKLSNNDLVSTSLYQPIKRVNQQWWFMQQTSNASGAVTGLKLISLIVQGPI